MKVEYPLQLWKSFNKKIWANKQFALFLYVFIILGTVLLRQSPNLYYGFLDNSVYLTLIVLVILALSLHNMTLGILLTVALLALYYPSHIITKTMEGFEEENTEVDPTDDNIDDGEDEPEKKELEEEEKPKKQKKKTKKKEEDSLDIRGLEDLNPEFYKRDDDQGEEADDEDDQEELTPAPTGKPREKESFLGEVREVFYDLDSGKSKMNVKGAVKKITDLVYHKRRNEIEDILREEEDDSETSSDEDYF